MEGKIERKEAGNEYIPCSYPEPTDPLNIFKVILSDEGIKEASYSSGKIRVVHRLAGSCKVPIDAEDLAMRSFAQEMISRYAKSNRMLHVRIISEENIVFEINLEIFRLSAKRLKLISHDTNASILESADGKRYYFSNLYLESDPFKIFFSLLGDDSIEDVMYDGSVIRIVHCSFGMCETNLVIPQEKAYEFAFFVANENRKRLDSINPQIDASINGARANIVIPPITSAITITIRRFRKKEHTICDMIREGAISPLASAFLWAAISRLADPKNLIICGGTGSGKTTMLNILSIFIPSDERVIIIEDSREVDLEQKNCVSMLTNPELNIDMDSLLINSLRMRPDRIIVGEVRGKEATTLFSALNTGHGGSMGTVHANSARELISRITSPPMNVPHNMLGALHIIIVMKRAGNLRYVDEIVEVTGATKDSVMKNTLFLWDQKSRQLNPTGIPSRLKMNMAQESARSIQDIDSIIDRYRSRLESMAELGLPKEKIVGIIEEESKK